MSKKQTCEAGGKIGSLSKGKFNVSKGKKPIKKNQMENLEMKNTVKKKKSMDGPKMMNEQKKETVIQKIKQ